MPPTINILSAGAVKPGLTKVVKEYQGRAHEEVALSFATAPAIPERIERGDNFDLVIAPAAVLDRLEETGRIAAERVMVGRIGVGVVVRDGTPMPLLKTVEELKSALLDSESVVYNRASTGNYLEALFERLGISDQIAAKTTRCADFAAVLEHLRRGKGREFGFGATTVIVENAGEGIAYAGPLPAEIQNYTSYWAALTPAGDGKQAARELLRYLKTRPAKIRFAESGVD